MDEQSTAEQRIAEVLTCLLIRYGDEWVRKWEGIDAKAIVADWRRECGHLPARRMLWALDNLPERAPHAGQFRVLCMQAPAPESTKLALEGPPPDPERTRAARAAAYERLGIPPPWDRH